MEMPDYRVYIPEAKAPVLYQFKEQFGKDGSPMVVNFMEERLTAAGQTSGNKETEISRIFELYFGDIENERNFIDLLSSRENAEAAVIHRSDELYRKYPELYLDVIAQFKEKYPKFAEIKGV